MANQDKKPQIRFAGFAGDWEQRKLGEIGKTFSGLSGKTKEDFGSGDARYITYMNVFLNPLANKNGTEKTGIDKKQNQVMRGDVLFTTSSETPEEVGMSSVWLHDEPNIYLNSFCFGFRADLVFDYSYFAFFLRSQEFRRKMELLAQGISRYNISKNRVMDIRISLPSLLEQTRIGNFFRNLDSLITQHQQELEKLKIMKKAMLEKMFPKAGAAVPEIRFAGFTGDWERRKLSDISNKVVEKNVNLQIIETFTNSAEFGVISQRDYFDHEISNIKNLNGYYVVRVEDFVYNPRISILAPVGPINRNRLGRNGVMSPLYTVFRTHDIDNSFLEQYFKSNYWHYFMKVNGDSGARSDRFSIKDNVFIEMPIPYPELNEQLKIGKYLNNLDTLITQHQRKRDKLVLIKKAMLGKMFV